MTLTDEIYAQLKNGLWTGLDYDGLRLKHEKSKGPFYNALQMVLADAKAEITKLSSELKALKEKGDEEKVKLKSLVNEQQKAADEIKARRQEVESLGREEQIIKAKIQELSAELNARAGLLNQIQELEKIGFDSEKVQQLRDVIVEIGTKQGQKPDEAIGRFFNDLQDYDAMVGFKREVQRLETITGTKKLEAERWQAEADSLARRHKDLSEAITAAQSLIKQGVKTEQIVAWHGIVSKLGGPEELQGKLGQYGSMSQLLTTKKKEIEDCEKRVTELSAQVKALSEQKVEIEGAIKSLSSSGVKEIANVSDKAMTGLKSLSSSGVKEITEVSGKSLTELKSLSTSGVQEITKVGDKALTELKSLLAEIRTETGRLGDLKAEAGKLEKELMYARYLTTGDQAVLKSFPKEVVIAFLDRASSYCKLNQLNPMVRVPDSLSGKYLSVYSSTQVSLLDLIAWAEVGLVGAVQ